MGITIDYEPIRRQLDAALAMSKKRLDAAKEARNKAKVEYDAALADFKEVKDEADKFNKGFPKPRGRKKATTAADATPTRGGARKKKKGAAKKKAVAKKTRGRKKAATAAPAKKEKGTVSFIWPLSSNKGCPNRKYWKPLPKPGA